VACLRWDADRFGGGGGGMGQVPWYLSRGRLGAPGERIGAGVCLLALTPHAPHADDRARRAGPVAALPDSTRWRLRGISWAPVS
jgi:hypothetical protein